MAVQIALQKYIEKGDKQRRQLASDKAPTREESIKKLPEIIERRSLPAQLAIQAPGGEVEKTAEDTDNRRIGKATDHKDSSGIEKAAGDKENRAIAETVGDIDEKTSTHKDPVD